jgi:transcriptional regulator with XRE-family HTH domain
MSMPANPTAHRYDHTTRLRTEAGLYLKRLRTEAGLTQVELAQATGMNYYTMISQIEMGRGFIPADRWLDFAKALGVEPEAFAKDMLRFTNPWAWAMIFGSPRQYHKLVEEMPQAQRRT